MSTVSLYGIHIVSLMIENQERLCLAQISNTLLKQFSYNEIHNRRVALGITCVQCTPVQLEILRRAGAMPVSSRRCGMITRREAERLCKSFLGDNTPPRLAHLIKEFKTSVDEVHFQTLANLLWNLRKQEVRCHYKLFNIVTFFIFIKHANPKLRFNVFQLLILIIMKVNKPYCWRRYISDLTFRHTSVIFKNSKRSWTILYKLGFFFIKKILKINHYPEKFINYHVNKRMKTHNTMKMNLKQLKHQKH